MGTGSRRVCQTVWFTIIDDLLDEQEVEMILKGVKENKRLLF